MDFFEEDDNDFLASPLIKENTALLHDIGVLDYIETMKRNIYYFKSLLVKGLDIFNRTSIDEIIDTTIHQISDHFLPSFIAFLWKPIQTREDITMKAFKNYKPVDLNLHVDSITNLEIYFRQHPKPVNFELLASQLSNGEALKPYLDINTEIVVPIIGPFGLYGVILVGKKILNEGYSREELFFLQQLMSFVSQAIKNHLHYEYSLRDVKTGLYNHGFFLARINEEVTRIKRNGGQSSIIMIDVDKFKNFNNSYGHLAGDKVLEHLAQVIKLSVRGDDIPSRFGGEEFTILLPNADKTIVWNVAERLRVNVVEMKVPWENPLPQVTISIGIYTFDKNTNADVSAMIRHADEALYVSKERGRNRCTVWNSGIIGQQSGEGSSIEKNPAHGPALEVV
ncbi:MAG: sensor domain-containing diguanylate cyclase [Treponema sp.]|jgi:diguanylate cyclase (GGDEF)-like protein|nr:sensor domain-containing diguanylate cyclase [Treponema sp.]